MFAKLFLWLAISYLADKMESYGFSFYKKKYRSKGL